MCSASYSSAPEVWPVGTFHRVPCVTQMFGVTIRRHYYPAGTVWPVISGAHEDREIIGFAAVHYHIDWRFVGKRNFQRSIIRDVGKVWGAVIHEDTLTGPPVLRKMKYQRNVPWTTDIINVPWLDALEIAHKDARLKCNTCPHRGISLTGIPADEHGVVVCPGHGLAWTREDGRLVPRAIYRKATTPLAARRKAAVHSS